MENSKVVPQKTKNKLPYDPAILFLGIYPDKIVIQKNIEYMHPYVHSNTIYNSQDMEAA